MTRLNNIEHPTHDIVAFNFGLFETIEGFTLYLTGLKKYDPKNDDWALEPDFETKEEYLDINLDETAGLDSAGVLKKTTDLIVQYIDSEEFRHSILKHASVITTGFDDGAFTRIK